MIRKPWSSTDLRISIELNKVAWVNLYIINLHVYIVMSSPFLFVFGGDRVTCHTWGDEVLSDVGDAKIQREDHYGRFIITIYDCSSIYF